MDNSSRIQLDKLIKEYKTEDTTNKIRKLKHSKKIHKDVECMEKLKQSHSRTRINTPTIFRGMCEKNCKFLYDNYTNIFNKLYKDELNLETMNRFLNILREIEEGIVDQHEGSYKVGQILKELYVDSAIRHKKNDENKDNKRKNSKDKKAKKQKTLSWNEYKLLHSMD